MGNSQAKSSGTWYHAEVFCENYELLKQPSCIYGNISALHTSEKPVN